MIRLRGIIINKKYQINLGYLIILLLIQINSSKKKNTLVNSLEIKQDKRTKLENSSYAG